MRIAFVLIKKTYATFGKHRLSSSFLFRSARNNKYFCTDSSKNMFVAELVGAARFHSREAESQSRGSAHISLSHDDARGKFFPSSEQQSSPAAIDGTSAPRARNLRERSNYHYTENLCVSIGSHSPALITALIQPLRRYAVHPWESPGWKENPSGSAPLPRVLFRDRDRSVVPFRTGWGRPNPDNERETPNNGRGTTLFFFLSFLFLFLFSSAQSRRSINTDARPRASPPRGTVP